MKPANTWGEALEMLRLKRHPKDLGVTSKKVLASGEVSYRQMAMLGIVGQTEYTRWITGPQGPTVSSLGRWLEGMKYTWEDWAHAINEVQDTRHKPSYSPPDRKRPRDGPDRRSNRPQKKYG